MLIDTTYNMRGLFAIASRKVYDLMYKLYELYLFFVWLGDSTQVFRKLKLTGNCFKFTANSFPVSHLSRITRTPEQDTGNLVKIASTDEHSSYTCYFLPALACFVISWIVFIKTEN